MAHSIGMFLFPCCSNAASQSDTDWQVSLSSVMLLVTSYHRCFSFPFPFFILSFLCISFCFALLSWLLLRFPFQLLWSAIISDSISFSLWQWFLSYLLCCLLIRYSTSLSLSVFMPLLESNPIWLVSPSNESFRCLGLCICHPPILHWMSFCHILSLSLFLCLCFCLALGLAV